MFMLTNSSGEVQRLKNGDPFTYTNEALAKLGRKYRAKHLGVVLNIVPFG